jgi:hypothetical protein
MKLKRIKTILPKNLPEKFLFVFKRREYYRFPELKIKERKNIFLSHGGILINNLLPVMHSLPNAFGLRKPNAGFIYQFYRKGLEVFLVCKYGKSLKSKKLDLDKKYLFVFSPWFGYFSWVTESLPRIYSVKKMHSDLTLILPETYSKKKFVINSLELFPNLKYEIIPEGMHMQIPKLIMPELKPFTYTFDPQTMIEYREKIWEYVEQLDIKTEKKSRIYVSRKKAKNRKVINDSEVVNMFKKFGYSEVEFEDYNFFEQVYLMKNCDVLAGVHGAGFANIAFMPNDSNLFELIKEYSSYKEERPSYWRLSSALNINYYIQYCEPEKYDNYDLWIGVNLKVDLELLKENLNTLEQSSIHPRK